MDYIIGAGAILESGDHGTITPATLHAHVDPAVASSVAVAAIDFESAHLTGLKRLLVLAQGWNSARFRVDVTDRLRERRESTIADVFRTLAQASGATEVHLFAHWLPDDQTCASLLADGIAVVAHPLETIEAASLVTGQHRERWGPRAA